MTEVLLSFPWRHLLYGMLRYKNQKHSKHVVIISFLRNVALLDNTSHSHYFRGLQYFDSGQHNI